MVNKVNSFDWDDANREKNWKKHKVSYLEAEQIFFNQPVYVFKDDKHSEKESRWYCLGKTNQARKLFVVFTVRNSKIRVISARDMHKKEREIYEKKK